MSTDTVTLLASTDAVIDALGGTGVVARDLGVIPQAVTNWRARRRFPPSTYLVIKDRLSARGLDAPADLWGMR